MPPRTHDDERRPPRVIPADPAVEQFRIPITREALLDRLLAHRTLGTAPREELEWLADHGDMIRMDAGVVVGRKGHAMVSNPLMGLHIVLSGRMSHLTDHGGAWRKVMEWTAGDVTGMLPYSRMTVSPGNTVVDETLDMLLVPHPYVAEMPTRIPHTTAILVHVMVDRARVFKTSDQQIEKMASLGKLAAGVAHELNNPASAAARSARLLTDALAEGDDASDAVWSAGFTEAEVAAVRDVRTTCINSPATTARTPLERADREDEIARWLAGHGIREAFAATLADTAVELAALDGMARAVPSAKLEAALRWVAAGCTARGLAKDVERAASRVHELVSAIKGFTFMDHAATPEPFDVRKGLTDTLAVLGNKVRTQSISLTVEVPDGLPPALGIGGEMNQVWANLIDNALDAAGAGGVVRVSAQQEGRSIAVRVADNGPGVPPDLQQRIFDPFFTTKPVGTGTGLGLDIVRRVVEGNGGRVELASVPGNTVFQVTLPLA